MQPVLLTVTWRQDLERFRLLRRSLRQVSCDWRHIVVVHTEDDRVAFAEPGVEVVPTSAFLDRGIERRRRAQHYPRRHWRHWVRGVIPGWYAQQLVKLAAAASLGGVVVHLDSDLVALRPLTEGMFTDAGRTRFFVNDDMREDGTEEWNRTAAAFLGVPVVQRQYIHWPTVWDGPTVAAMLASVWQPWQQAFTAANVYEFPAYGVWATAQGGLVESPPLPVANFAVWEQMIDFEAAAQEARRSGVVFAGVQSRLHIPPDAYAHVLLG